MMAFQKTALCILAMLVVTSCGANGYIPVGVGSIIHVCGEIVDEELKPIKGKYEMGVQVTRPLLTIKGDSKIDEYTKIVKAPNFCLNYGYAWDVTAFLKSDKFIAPTLSIGRGMVRSNFKWVVEKRDTIIKDDNLTARSLVWGPSDTNRSFSSGIGGFPWKQSKDSNWGVGNAEEEIDLFSKMGGVYDGKKKKSEAVKEWVKSNPGIFSLDSTVNPPRYILLKPIYFADIIMERKSDSLVLVAGPLVKTKFAAATIDSPACNLTRMANPPPVGNIAWQDSLIIAVGDKVLLDGFYAYFPWNDYWAKVLLDTVLNKQADRTSIRYFLMQEKVKERPTFPNKIDGHNDFFLRKKCLTKAEKMWAGEYNTTFKSE